jgi:hypothetical protein
MAGGVRGQLTVSHKVCRGRPGFLCHLQGKGTGQGVRSGGCRGIGRGYCEPRPCQTYCVPGPVEARSCCVAQPGLKLPNLPQPPPVAGITGTHHYTQDSRIFAQFCFTEFSHGSTEFSRPRMEFKAGTTDVCVESLQPAQSRSKMGRGLCGDGGGRTVV